MSPTDGITEGLSGKERMELRAEVAGGLRYAHRRASANTGKLLEVASFAYAAIELLAEISASGAISTMDALTRILKSYSMPKLSWSIVERC